MGDQANSPGGTGTRFGNIVVILAGVAAISASLLTVVSVWLQAKNYRKPLLQRYVVRILLMVPIYSAASWASLMSLRVAFWIDPFRDVYEAFTIYTFFQLLINFLGGERSLIIMMHGRPPVSHPWPLSHCFAKVDISDPHSFLAVKRGILQYTWVKPTLAVATIIMKATDTYQEGYIGLNSGYFWSGLIYNISICWSLYALAMFWVCMSQDLQPFRPMPKFLCIKGIIFASYWQGFFLSILVWIGALPDDVPGYSPDNLAASIQDALICFEMPAFALAHWYAFSWHDYADKTISAARMPIKFALRDAFGPRDLIEDTKETFAGNNYEYRHFDAYDNVIAHEESSSREARLREGMRYERGGKGKYWIPKPGHVHDQTRTPLLNKNASRARTMSPGASHALHSETYGTTEEEVDDPILNPEEEQLYDNARALEFGDWNYPVITAHTPSRMERLYADPEIVTSSTNRHVLQPTRENKRRRKSRIQEIQQNIDKSKRSSSSGNDEGSSSKQVPALGKLLSRESSSSSRKSDRSQLVDLVVEDHEAETVERVRARKEGGPTWNESETKRYVRTYPTTEQAEDVRQGYEPTQAEPPQLHASDDEHNLDEPFVVGDDDTPRKDYSGIQSTSEEAQQYWQRREYTADQGSQQADDQQASPRYGSFNDERNAWGTRDSV
ncbi:DUF300-domain-containing protein [Rhizodiscina lignyota]|uniref:DUF300-domain-containing protein n=1 Tax=Rhizodiscina lignyota TaxID=1504668 RepID=A0A9P4IHK4_9PEZI|nr:DUF300-domain-containing protein [Rhizodiscina lignyota]